MWVTVTQQPEGAGHRAVLSKVVITVDLVIYNGRSKNL